MQIRPTPFLVVYSGDTSVNNDRCSPKFVNKTSKAIDDLASPYFFKLEGSTQSLQGRVHFGSES
jgi:hypothetical protein